MACLIVTIPQEVFDIILSNDLDMSDLAPLRLCCRDLRQKTHVHFGRDYIQRFRVPISMTQLRDLTNVLRGSRQPSVVVYARIASLSGEKISRTTKRRVQRAARSAAGKVGDGDVQYRNRMINLQEERIKALSAVFNGLPKLHTVETGDSHLHHDVVVRDGLGTYIFVTFMALQRSSNRIHTVWGGCRGPALGLHVSGMNARPNLENLSVLRLRLDKDAGYKDTRSTLPLIDFIKNAPTLEVLQLHLDSKRRTTPSVMRHIVVASLPKLKHLDFRDTYSLV